MWEKRQTVRWTVWGDKGGWRWDSKVMLLQYTIGFPLLKIKQSLVPNSDIAKVRPTGIQNALWARGIAFFEKIRQARRCPPRKERRDPGKCWKIDKHKSTVWRTGQGKKPANKYLQRKCVMKARKYEWGTALEGNHLTVMHGEQLQSKLRCLRPQPDAAAPWAARDSGTAEDTAAPGRLTEFSASLACAAGLGRWRGARAERRPRCRLWGPQLHLVPPGRAQPAPQPLHRRPCKEPEQGLKIMPVLLIGSYDWSASSRIGPHCLPHWGEGWFVMCHTGGFSFKKIYLKKRTI